MRRALRAGLVAASLGLLSLGGLAAAQYRQATARAPLLLEPRSLAADPDGDFYYVIRHGRIVRFDAEGRVARVWPTPGGREGARLRVEADGRLYAVSPGGEWARYDRDGQVLAEGREEGAHAAVEAATEAAWRDGGRLLLRDGAVLRSPPDPPAVLVPGIPAPLSWLDGRVVWLVPVLALGPVGLIAAAALPRRPASPGSRS